MIVLTTLSSWNEFTVNCASSLYEILQFWGNKRYRGEIEPRAIRPSETRGIHKPCGQIFRHFWPPSPSWTILLNKAYVVMWTFELTSRTKMLPVNVMVNVNVIFHNVPTKMSAIIYTYLNWCVGSKNATSEL